MELWVRSQDKLLLTKIDYILVNGLDIFNQNQLIGTYKTYERTLEILDEIQKTLMPIIVFKDEGRDYITPQGQIYKLNIKQPINTDMQQLSSYVYEMPKE